MPNELCLFILILLFGRFFHTRRMILLTTILLTALPVILCQSVPGECNNYTSLVGSNHLHRFLAFRATSRGTHLHDGDFTKEWFRFEMPEAKRILEIAEIPSTIFVLRDWRPTFRPCGTDMYTRIMFKNSRFLILMETSWIYGIQNHHPREKYSTLETTAIGCTFQAISNSPESCNLVTHDCNFQRVCDATRSAVRITVRNCDGFFVYRAKDNLPIPPPRSGTSIKPGIFCGTKLNLSPLESSATPMFSLKPSTPIASLVPTPSVMLSTNLPMSATRVSILSVNSSSSMISTSSRSTSSAESSKMSRSVPVSATVAKSMVLPTYSGSAIFSTSFGATSLNMSTASSITASVSTSPIMPTNFTSSILKPPILIASSTQFVVTSRKTLTTLETTARMTKEITSTLSLTSVTSTQTPSSPPPMPLECKQQNHVLLTEKYRSLSIKSYHNESENEHDRTNRIIFNWFRFASPQASRMLEIDEVPDNMTAEAVSFKPCGTTLSLIKHGPIFGTVVFALTSHFYVLDGKHPTSRYDEMVTTAQGCDFGGILSGPNQNCHGNIISYSCNWILTCNSRFDQVPIKVRNCGHFYVYKLLHALPIPVRIPDVDSPGRFNYRKPGILCGRN